MSTGTSKPARWVREAVGSEGNRYQCYTRGNLLILRTGSTLYPFSVQHAPTRLAFGSYSSFRTLTAAKRFCDSLETVCRDVVACGTDHEASAEAARWGERNGSSLRITINKLAHSLRD